MKAVRWIDRLASVLGGVYIIDHALKLASIAHFFRRSRPQPLTQWPRVTLFQPVTRGASNLREALRSRACLDYPGPIEHLFICDEYDLTSQEVCRQVMADYPEMQGQIIKISFAMGNVASKLEKLLAALPHATGEVFWFLDDDITLRPDAFRLTIPYLFEPQVGAVFGLACYTDWRNPSSALMSTFVNAHALFSYIPITYLTEPYTITGHCFALRRQVFKRAGGFTGLATRIDDDHEMARRVRKLGLQVVQTPLIYDVDNYLPTMRDYNVQMKRWFTIPRQVIVPTLSRKEQASSLVAGIGMYILPVLGMLAFITGNRAFWRVFLQCMGLACGSYAACEALYYQRRTPVRYWWMVPLTFVLSPFHILRVLLSDDRIEWRGQQLRVHRGGELDVLSTPPVSN